MKIMTALTHLRNFSVGALHDATNRRSRHGKVLLHREANTWKTNGIQVMSVL